MSDNKSLGYYLSWDSITCNVNGSTLLEDVSGYCAPGTSMCILGASGAGKTTLVDILARRKTTGKIEGQLLVNGNAPNEMYNRRLGYVLAETVHIPTMTVWETLEFAANLRMPKEISDEEKKQKIQNVIDGLKLSHVQNIPVGNELLRGLSSGEKKRLDIGIELLSEPKLIFLDEPTSGLDEYGARFTMKLVLEYAKKQNVTTISVIHQPSLSVYQLFDSVYLLGQGKVCFFGKVSEAEEFFTNYGQPTPQYVNPIEHYIDVIAKDPPKIAAFYNNSENYTLNKKKIANLSNNVGSVANFTVEGDTRPLFEQSFGRQYQLVLHRTVVRYIRSPSMSWGRVIIALVLACIMGGVFYNLDNDLVGFRLRISLSACLGFLPAFIAASALPQFLEDRELFFQEHASGFYTTAAYHLSYFTVEACILLVINFLQSTIIFYLANLRSDTYGQFIALLLLQTLISISVSQLMGCWCQTLMQAYSALVAYGIVCFVFSGTQANLDLLANGFLIFVSRIVYWRYTITYLLKLQMTGFQIVCKTEQLVPVNMNTLVPSIATSVQAALTASYPSTDKADYIQALREVGALASMRGWIQLDAAQANYVLNTTALPLGPPLSTSQFPTGTMTDLTTGIGATAQLKSIDLTNSTGLALNLRNAAIWGLWNATYEMAQNKIFPDFSRCFITDSTEYVKKNFGVDDSLNESVYGISFGFFVFHITVAHIGLHWSRRYKKPQQCTPYTGSVCKDIVTWNIDSSIQAQTEQSLSSLFNSRDGKFETIRAFNPGCAEVLKDFLCVDYFKECRGVNST
ncbi:hypothetical protein HDV05_004054, partial [Chytridiales sp. JEL 0842]